MRTNVVVSRAALNAQDGSVDVELRSPWGLAYQGMHVDGDFLLETMRFRVSEPVGRRMFAEGRKYRVIIEEEI